MIPIAIVIVILIVKLIPSLIAGASQETQFQFDFESSELHFDLLLVVHFDLQWQFEFYEDNNKDTK